MNYQRNSDRPDELRARFTTWLSSTLKNARNMYYRSQKNKLETISFDELPDELQIDPLNPFDRIERSYDAFDFEEEKLARAFYELPLMRREVLRLLFVCELTPDEISRRLHCSVNFVHLQKSRALKKLRSVLEED